MGSKSSRLRNNHNQNQGTPSSTTSRSTVNSAFTLNGLYSECSWDSKAIKALIVNKRLAPLHRGSEQEIRITKPIIATKYNEECPICFLFYTGGLNRTVCCKKCICTECFLQIKPPTKKVPCPFCNSDVLFVIFKGPLSVEEIEKEEMERKILEDHAERVLEEQRNSSTRRNTLSKEDLVVAIDVEAFGGKTDATETEQVAADHDTNPDQQGNDAVALDTADADADAFCSSSSSLRSSSSSSSSSSASSSSSLAASDDESDNAAQRVKNSGRRHKNKHKDKPVPAAAFVAAAAPNSNNDEPVVNAANDGQVAFDVLSSVGVGSHPNSLPPGMTVESLENLMIEQAIRLSLQQANDKKDVTASSSSSINTNQPQHQQHQQPEELHQQAHQASADAHLSPLASTEHDNDDDNNHAAIIVVNDDADDDATPTLMQVPATATTTVMSSSSSSSTVVPKKTSRASSLSRRSSRGGAARDSADFSSISDSQSGIDPSPLTVPTMSSSTTSCNDDDDDPREESVLASPDTSSKLSIVHFDTAVAADGDKPRSKSHRRRKSSLAAKVSSSSAPGQVSATAAATAAATSASSSSSSSSSRRRSSKSALSRSAQGKMY